MYTKGFSICLSGRPYWYDPLLPCKSISFGYVSSNRLDPSRCRSVKQKWPCTCWNAMVLLKYIQSVSDHALIFLLYHCTVGSIALVLDIVSPVTVGQVWFRFRGLLYLWLFCCNEDGNRCFLRILSTLLDGIVHDFNV